MTMKPRLRTFALATHVTVSVGWLGAIVAFLALAVIGLTSQDAQTVRAAYIAAEPIIRFVIVPLAVASLLTGLVSALGTPWGLFRHYWVLFKLVINIIATALLLMYLPTVDTFAAIAAQPNADLSPLRSPTFLLHAAGALVVLLLATILAVYKPRGMTRYGQRRTAKPRPPLRIS